ncbi:MAG TPA: phosphoribosylglycinamide formyltransferase [Candidatus Nanopelagicales bacterium]|nr:phosphoribosylglycinamide formyltransferase [Candidatus Nanopelagicales bacterium]
MLISGRGSNMRSIVEARTGLAIRAVISNRPDAKGLEWARSQSLPTQVVDHKAFPTREAFEGALAQAIEPLRPDMILLAGFMRIFTPAFIARFPRRILNIHPSLLPAFPGLHTHRQALAAGVKLHGATVHVVTPSLDSGPIVAQAAVPVLAGDTEDTLAARVLRAEHRIYPQAVRWFLEDRIEFLPGDVVRVRGSGVDEDCVVSPRDPRK